MKLNKPSCNICKALQKAIEAYIAKVDNDLENSMDDAGYVDSKDSVNAASDLEEEVTEILTEQTEELADVIEEAGTIPKAKKAVEEYFEDDVTGEILSATFRDYFSETILSLSDSYMKEVEGDMAVTQLRARTTAWVNQWSNELANVMQLTSADKMKSLLQEALDSDKGAVVFARSLIDEGIRQEAYRARTVAVTEMLRAHSVAQQEAIMQSPATDRKKWRHSGAHKNEPRPNHVAMDGQIVPKADPFVLTGRDGGTYYPMYPRDTELPPFESINCHCIHVPVTNDDVLGMSYEERKKMQEDFIAADDGEWEKELDALNRSRSENSSNVNVSGETSYMNSFKPQLGKEAEITFKNNGQTINVAAHKVSNSKFEMYLGDIVSPRNRMVRIAEKQMQEVVKGLPEDIELPKILICNFDDIEKFSSTAIGGYNHESNLMLFNAKYKTEKSIVNFLKKKPGFFASTDLIAPFKHESGHLYHNYLLKKIENYYGIGYNEAWDMFKGKINTVVKQMSASHGDVIKRQLSDYAYKYYLFSGNPEDIGEIMSEWYTVKDKEITTEFVDAITDIEKEVLGL